MNLKLFFIIFAILTSNAGTVFADDLINPEYLYKSENYTNENTWDGITITEVIPENGEYQIYTAAQLAWVAQEINSMNDNLIRATISLHSDIDLGGYNWTPIGYSYNTPFAGRFQGNGYTISGLNFDSSSYTHGGLFGCVIGKISNLNVCGNIETSRCLTPSSSDPSKNGIGILAGSLDARNFDYDTKDYVGIIEDCHIDGSVTIHNSYGEIFYVGGIVGMNSGGELCRSFSQVDITIESTSSNGTDEAFVGSIAGYSGGYCSGNSSVCSISVQSSNPTAGGIVGKNSGTLVNSNSESYFQLNKNISVFDDNYANIGGIAGVNTGIIEASSSEISFDSSTSAEDYQLNAGGICGMMYGEISDDDTILSTAVISDCTSLVNTEISVNSPQNIGGIIGMVSNKAGITSDCIASPTFYIKSSSYRINAGGIAGTTHGIIDSCIITDANLVIHTSAPASVGTVAGISYNTVSDCKVSESYIAVSSNSPISMLYCGGISGESYGRIRRCSADAILDVSGTLSYTGGIAGRAENSSTKSIISSDCEGLISKCTSNTSISSTNIAGGIAGDAHNAFIQRSHSKSDISNSVGAGGVAGRASSLTIENCLIEGTLNTNSNCGAVYEFTNSDNSISTSYFAPVMIGDFNNAVSITDTTKYIIRRSYINTDTTNVNDIYGITALTNETAQIRESFDKLNFNSIWSLKDNKIVLQHTIKSNASVTTKNITETRMQFDVSLENPIIGQRVYVALYDIDDRFCGVASALCKEENINLSASRANIPIEYSYSYWDLDKWWNTGEWEPTEGLPFTYKAYTWDEENEMKSLSSVDEGVLTYYFE